MRAALVVHQISTAMDPGKNLDLIEGLFVDAVQGGAELVLFPEFAVMTETLDLRPEHDLPLGQAVPGSVTHRLGNIACAGHAYLGIGMLERDRACLYDSALLFNPAGQLDMKYRRLDPHWHALDSDPAIYCEGDEIPSVATNLGSVAMAICGDLFNDAVVAQLRRLAPDYLLLIMDRCFGDGSFDQQRWDREEERSYVNQARLTGCHTLLVNRLDDPVSFEYPSFGGAMVISKAGEVIARWPLGQPGILHCEI